MNEAKPVTRLGQLSWGVYQLAAAPYFVIVNIFVFSAYFQKHVVGDNVEGQATWGYAQAAAGVLIPLLAPVLGALADAYGPRKPGVIVFSMAAIPAMLALWLVTPGQVALGFAAIVVAAVAMECAALYHNAMLTSVSTPRNIGFISGLAYSFDYIGSVSVFLLWLALPALGILALIDEPFAHERLVGPLSVLWLVVFSLPLLFFTPDVPRTGLSQFAAIRKGLSQLRNTISKVSHYRNLATFLVVRAIYADGMSAVFAFLAGYMSGVFGWETTKIGIYALVVLTVPIFTSFAAGWIDDKIGSKRAIQICLTVFTLAVAGSVSMTPNEYLLFFPITDEMRDQQLAVVGPIFALFGFTQFAEQLSLLFSVTGGAFVGPVLASSRTMVARLAPPTMISEVYGLYTLTGKATAFLAPALVAFVTSQTQNQRIGFEVILVFLVLGLWGLSLVREERAETAPQ
jgi:UMF1 family MFS transporter